MKKISPLLKKILLGIIIVSIVGIWYLYNNKFSDTSKVRPDFIVNALDFIHEFEKNDSLANKKYTEKILVVNGVVTEMETADSLVNVKMADTTSGSYIIFAFQQQDLGDVKKIKQGDHVAIKGSCSGGAYSQILETEFITFKRSTINK